MHNRGIPIPTEPTTIGGYLRRRRMQLRIFHPEAARLLGVSTVTLSRWECDKVYPTTEFHASLIEYIGAAPFATIPNPELQNLKSNESLDVAILSPSDRLAFSIKKARLEQKLTAKACAKKLQVDPKTLRDWERGKHKPIGYLRKRVIAFMAGKNPMLNSVPGAV